MKPRPRAAYHFMFVSAEPGTEGFQRHHLHTTTSLLDTTHLTHKPPTNSTFKQALATPSVQATPPIQAEHHHHTHNPLCHAITTPLPRRPSRHTCHPHLRPAPFTTEE